MAFRCLQNWRRARFLSFLLVSLLNFFWKTFLHLGLLHHP